MRLVKFSVTNYRSITTAHKIPISNSTILIGRNNEGKSNLLRSLSIAMNLLKNHATKIIRTPVTRGLTYRTPRRTYYSWDTDFPIALQKGKGSKQSVFKLEFELDDDEVQKFKEEIKSHLNGTLPLEIKIGKDEEPTIKVSKKGRGSTALNSKSEKIAEFIAQRISFNYIPAIRTDQEALSVISDMLSQELLVLEQAEKYQEALNHISELQKPLLDKLAKRILEPLSEFLPNILNVEIEIQEEVRRFGLRRDFEVYVNDGTRTPIEYKGDGVKSLAALGLLKNRHIESGVSIIAIEEPESHLHPAAIHQLNEIITSLAESSQVIITTHNPLFVDRHNIKSNIIVDNGTAAPAKNVREIRELLGIKASDNLIGANFALVVEGNEDKTALKAILPTLSDKIAKALRNNILVIDPIGGAGSLSYKLSLLKNSLCVYHVLLDNDDAGRNAFNNASRDNLLSLKNITLVNCNGMPNSEFEDCINPEIYKDEILNRFGVNINDSVFRCNLQWSNRMKKVFQKQGKLWDDETERDIKKCVASSIEKHPTSALNPHKRQSIDALVEALDRLLVNK